MIKHCHTRNNGYNLVTLPQGSSATVHVPELPFSEIIYYCYTWPLQGLEIDEFPLLMPAVKPDREETYLCTPIRLDTDLTFFIVGFKPNASMHTAHHMLIYGCEEPGNKWLPVSCHDMS